MFSTMNILTSALFVSVALGVAALLPFSYLIIASAIPSLLFLIVAIPCLPESPIWYAKKCRIQDARFSLQWLRGTKYDLTEELNEMENMLANKQSWKETIHESTQRKSLIPICMMLAFMSLQV